jgi:hypothetical protein
MNKPTFTKGPWTVTDWHIATKDGPIIATINEDEFTARSQASVKVLRLWRLPKGTLA